MVDTEHIDQTLERIAYFSDVLEPRYEKHFNTSLKGAIFWNPVNIVFYPEEVERAISRLETALEKNEPIDEDDIQWYNPDVIY